MTNKIPSRVVRLLIAVAVLTSCIGCDQATKAIATRSLRHAPPHSYLGDTLRLEYALNPGGFLGLGDSLPASVRMWVFVGLNLALMSAVAGGLLVRWNIRPVVFVAGLFVLAGGVGNLIDRLASGGLVTDFLIVGVGPLRTGVFNVADMAVLFGSLAAIWFLPAASRTRDHSPHKEQSPVEGKS